MLITIRYLSRVLTVVFVATALVGCGGEEPDSFSTASSSMRGDEAASVAESKAASEPAPGSPPAPGSGFQTQAVSAVPRKIIYTAEVSLIVEQLNPAQRKLVALVRAHKGYVAETSIGGEAGAPRSGRWKVRVPVDGYQSFVDAISEIGEVQKLDTNSQDVSAEFYDIEARLRNKRVEEKRLLEHLNRSTAKLSDILLIEKEISRVRGEIEQMQGRLQVLSNLTALTTVTVTINEVKDYIPPAPPSFTTEMTRSFQSSFGGLINFGKGVVLTAVAVFPWFVALAIVILPLWLMMRRRTRPATIEP